MILLAIVLLIGAFWTAAIAMGLIGLPNRTIRRRIKVIAAAPDKPEQKTVVVEDEPVSWLSRLTPLGLMTRIERNMVLAGRPDGWSRDRVIVAKPLGLAFGVFFAIVIIAKTSSPVLMIFAFGIVLLGYFVPDLLIYNHATKRQQEIQQSLPDTLDQIVISIEAGVGFEAALARAGEKGTGPLADEIVRLIQDIALGMSRREAYFALADRTTVDGLRTFAKAVVQAEEFGVSISSVVRTQAKEMRIARRARAEAKAQQVPVKILLPLMTCILPVLFIIVLGPPVTNAFRIM